MCLLAIVRGEKPPSSPASGRNPARPTVSGLGSPEAEVVEADETLPWPSAATSPSSPFTKLMAPLRNAFMPMTAAVAAQSEPLDLAASSKGAAEGEVPDQSEAPKPNWLMMIGMVVVQLALRVLLPYLLRRRGAASATAAAAAAASAAAESVSEVAEGVAGAAQEVMAEGVAQAASSIPEVSATVGYPGIVTWFLQLKAKFTAFSRSPQAAPVMMSLLILSTKLLQRLDPSLQERVPDDTGDRQSESELVAPLEDYVDGEATEVVEVGSAGGEEAPLENTKEGEEEAEAEPED